MCVRIPAEVKQAGISLPSSPPTLFGGQAKNGAAKVWTKFSPSPAVQSITNQLQVQTADFLGHVQWVQVQFWIEVIQIFIILTWCL